MTAPAKNAPLAVAAAPLLRPKAKLHRQLDTWHRALGFATLALLTATNVLGTLDYYDRFDARGSNTGQFSPWHEGVALGTTASFVGTGILGLIARAPEPRPTQLARVRAHQIGMGLAALGFAAQLVLGPITSISDGKLYQRDLAVTHVVLGWATLGFMGAGVLSYVF
jgi:hypothetical protein